MPSSRDDNRHPDLGDTLRAAAVSSFAPGFADRVMTRLPGRLDDAATALYDALWPFFLRLAVATVLLIGALGTYNATRYADDASGATMVEAALGLPTVTLDDAVGTPLLDTEG